MPGSILYGISILLLVYGASLFPEFKALVFIGIGTVRMLCFIWVERRVKAPVIDVSLFLQ